MDSFGRLDLPRRKLSLKGRKAARVAVFPRLYASWRSGRAGCDICLKKTRELVIRNQWCFELLTPFSFKHEPNWMISKLFSLRWFYWMRKNWTLNHLSAEVYEVGIVLVLPRGPWGVGTRSGWSVATSYRPNIPENVTFQVCDGFFQYLPGRLDSVRQLDFLIQWVWLHFTLHELETLLST